MKSITTLLICVLVSNTPTLAQSINRFGIQAGYLYSTSSLTPTTTYAIGLPTINPKPGYYIGLTYEHQLSTLLTGGLELTYQQKGYIGQIPYISESINTYRYLGLAPMASVRLVKNLHFLIGPQLNLLVNKSTNGLETQPLTNVSRQLEFGLVGRVKYQYNRVGLTASYFKGLTTYFKTDFYKLTNQNWQLGLYYQLNKNKLY
jgi:hypothetical protein